MAHQASHSFSLQLGSPTSQPAGSFLNIPVRVMNCKGEEFPLSLGMQGFRVQDQSQCRVLLWGDTFLHPTALFNQLRALKQYLSQVLIGAS